MGRDSSVGIAKGWTVRGSNPGGDDIFRNCPDRSSGPLSLLYNGYRVFLEDKASWAWRWPPTPSSAEVKEKVELYLYSLFESSWSVVGWTLPIWYWYPWWDFEAVPSYYMEMDKTTRWLLGAVCLTVRPSSHLRLKHTKARPDTDTLPWTLHLILNVTCKYCLNRLVGSFLRFFCKLPSIRGTRLIVLMTSFICRSTGAR